MKILDFLLTILIVVMLSFTNNCVYASMADYTDEDAEKDTQKMIQEHSEQFDSTKSNNCFLKELTINGGILSPNFDRQIVDYSVKVESNINEITINANPEDNKAKINGIGNIDIRNISECKIEVIAESGTTRTYSIKINQPNESNKSEEDNTNILNDNKNELLEESIDNVDASNKEFDAIIENENSNKMKNNRLNKYVFVGAGIIVILFISVFFIKLKTKKGKH